MPLILAVEPDRRQASRIAAVLRGRPCTELVIEGSVAAALEAVAARVPDLLLTSPLLSRPDEARLAEWLRDLGPAADQVQALTIPILATAAPAKATRGMLSVLWRRRPRTSSPDGCEPAVFADQVGLYLQRASVARGEAPVTTVPPEPPPAAIEADPPEPVVAAIDTDVSDQIEAVIALAPLPVDEDARWVPVPLDDARDAPARFPEPADAELGTDDVWVLTPVPRIEELPVVDLVPEQVEAIVAAPPVEVEAPPPEAVAAPPSRTTRRRKADKPKKMPVQDEWGFFDPNQCGFAALLHKLDEITAGETAADKKGDVSVRVISH